MLKLLRPALVLLAAMTFLLGLVYPAAVWLAGRIAFPHQAGGSLISLDGAMIGSELIGQNFTGDRYFWPRPSATSGTPYATLASGASNLNPAHPFHINQVKHRIVLLSHAHEKSGMIPADLVTASASGLDPHIFLAAALYQAERVAKARGMDAATVHALIKAHTEGKTLGFLGEVRVNVLLLNLALDKKKLETALHD